MADYEDRLQTVEFDLKRFQTETIKAYQDMAMEMAMSKGLVTDSIKRLMILQNQSDEIKRDVVEIKQDIASLHSKFDRLEKLILDRLPPSN